MERGAWWAIVCGVAKELDMAERLSCTELDGLGFSGGSVVKNPLANARDLGWVDPLEKEMATHFSILAWEIPWTEEPGRLQSMGSQRVRLN